MEIAGLLELIPEHLSAYCIYLLLRKKTDARHR